MKRKICFIAFLLSCFFNCFGQLDQLNLYSGIRLFPQDEKLDQTHNAENFFGGYKTGFVFGAGIDKYFGDNIGLSANVDYTHSSKSIYTLEMLKTSLVMKFCLFRFSTVSPYIFGGGNVNFMFIDQQSVSKDPETLPPGYSVSDSTHIPEDIITNRTGATSLALVPVFGFTGGGGVNVRLNEWFVVYGEYVFDYFFVTDASYIKTTFYHNKYNLNTSTFQVGVRVDLY